MFFFASDSINKIFPDSDSAQTRVDLDSGRTRRALLSSHQKDIMMRNLVHKNQVWLN